MNQATILRQEEQEFTVFGDENKLRYFYDVSRAVEGHKDKDGKWHGMILFYDDDKKTKPYKTAEFSHGVLNGETKQFSYERGVHIHKGNEYPNPKAIIESIFHYKEGKLHHSELYEKGRIQEITYQDGSGVYKKYHTNGLLKENGFFSEKGKEGQWEYFSNDGSLMSTVSYKSDQKSGLERIFDNGTIKSETLWLEGKKNGSQVEQIQSEDGSLNVRSFFVNDILEGKYAERLNEVLTVQGQYKNGVKEGVWEYHGEDNRLMKKETFLNGVLNGPILMVQSETHAIVGMMENGIRNGLFNYINSKTKLPFYAEIYEKGIPTKYVTYHEDGKLFERGFLTNSKREGIAIRTDKDGSETKIYYQAGKEVENPVIELAQEKSRTKSLSH